MTTAKGYSTKKKSWIVHCPDWNRTISTLHFDYSDAVEVATEAAKSHPARKFLIYEVVGGFETKIKETEFTLIEFD